jgi:hypothetical protein
MAARQPSADARARKALIHTPVDQSPARWHGGGRGQRNLLYLATLVVPLLVLGVSVLIFDLPVVAGLVASALVYGGLFLLNWRPRLEEERVSLRESIDQSLEKSRGLARQLHKLEPQLASVLSNTAQVRLRKICDLADNAASDLGSADGTTYQTASNLEHLLSETVDALGLYRQVARRTALDRDKSEKISAAIENDLLVVVESALADLSASFSDKESLRLEIAVQVLKNTVAAEGTPRLT